jgi:hypothetical protein
MSNTAQKCEGAKLRGDVNVFPARESAWARGMTPLVLLREFAYELVATDSVVNGGVVIVRLTTAE